MALSGTFRTTGFSDPGWPDHAVFSWNVTNSQADRVATNTSIVSWSLVAQGGSNQTRYSNTKEREITVQGVSRGKNTNVLKLVNGTVIYSGTTTVVHDNAGNANFSANAKLAIQSYGSYNSTGSGSWALDTIPRATKPSVNPTSQVVGSDVTINLPRASSTFTHDIRYRVGSGTWSSVTTGATTSYKWTLPSSLISSMGSGTSVGLTVGVTTKSGSTVIGSEQTFSLTATLPSAATLTSAPNFNDDSNPTINYTNPGGSLVSSLRVGIFEGSNNQVISYREIGKTGNSYTFNFTEAERNSLRTLLNDVNSKALRIYISTTYGSNNTRWHYLERTVSIVNATPVFSGVTYKDTNTTTTALTGSNQTIVNGQSNIQLTNFVTSVFKNATRKSVIIDGTSYTWVTNFNRTLNKYAKNNIPLQVVDSRGNSSSVYSKEFSKFINYSNVTSGLPSAKRSNNGVGESVTLVLSGTAWNGNFGTVTNNLTATYRYRVTGTSSWSSGISNLVLTRSGNNFTINQVISGDISGGFNIANSYDLEVTIKDRLSTKIATTTILGGEPALAFFKNNVSIGGQYDESRSNQPIQFNKSAFDKYGAEIVGGVSPSTTAYNYSNGVLIDICPASLQNMVVVDVIGNGYSGDVPIHSIFQVYHYQPFGTLMSAKQINIGGNLAAGKFLIDGDRLKLWITQSGQFQTLIVRAYGMSGVPYKVSISNVAEPSVAYKITCSVTTGGGGTFPVGAIYTSVSPTNPSTFFGGTWVPFATGRTLVGIDTSQTEFNSVKKTGGHKELQSHTHTFSGTTNSTGAHSHGIRRWNNNGTAGTAYVPNVEGHVKTRWDTNMSNSAGTHSHTVSGTIGSTGGGNAQNLQPYITVYMWERTA